MKIMRSRAGEVATLLTVLSVGAMFLGGLFGAQVTRLASRNLSTSQSSAGGACGASCSKNGDCSRTHTNQDGTKVNIACDLKVGKCLPASGEINRCDNGNSTSGTSLSNCDQACTSDRYCNKYDASDPAIQLGCDFATHTCQGGFSRGGSANGKQCPSRRASSQGSPGPSTGSTQVSSFPGGGSGGSTGGGLRITGGTQISLAPGAGLVTPIPVPASSGSCVFSSTFEIHDENNRKIVTPGQFAWSSTSLGNNATSTGVLLGSNPSLPYTYSNLSTALRNTFARVSLTSIPTGYELVSRFGNGQQDTTSFFCTSQSGDNGVSCRNAAIGFGSVPTINNIQLSCGGNIVYGFKVRKQGSVGTTGVSLTPPVPQPTSGNTGGGSGGSGGTGGTSSGETPRTLPTGAKFSSHSLQCGVGFKVVVDPVISSIIIKNRSGAGQFVLGSADSVFGSTTGRNTPVGYRMWQPRECWTSLTSPECNAFGDNLKIDWNPSTAGGNGISTPVLHVKLRSGGQIGSDPSFNDDTEVDLYYKNNVPSWMFDGSQKEVVFEYYVTNRVTRGREDYSQRETSGACTGIVTTPPVTIPTTIVTIPTVTPPTPSVTRPTIIVSQPPTPCTTNVHFLIDASETMRTFIEPSMKDLAKAIQDYANADFAKNDNITVTRQFFYRDLESASTPKNAKLITAADFAFPHNKHWTNIYEALQGGVQNNTVFISDGLPSVRKYSGQQSSWCVFGNGGQMKGGISTQRADGCKPDANVSGGYDNQLANCSQECTKKTYQNAYQESKSAGKAKFSVYVNTPDGDRPFMEAVSSEGAINFADLPAKLHDIFNATCNRPSTSTFTPTGSRSAAQFATSFSIANSSDNRTVQSMDIQTCKTGSSRCVKETKTLSVAPGKVERFASTMDISTLDTLSNSSLDVSCTLKYTNGQVDACPKRRVAKTEGIQMSLDLTDKIVRGTVKTYRQASDTNGDGVVNGLDLAICTQKHGSHVGPDVISACDIVSDNVINAQDRSVQLNYAGEKVTTN